MVIPLLGVKTRCADKSTAENYEYTYICGYVRGSPNGKICKSTNGTVDTIFTNGNQKTLNVFSAANGTNGTIGRSHGGIFIILINIHHFFLSVLFTSCILCYL